MQGDRSKAALDNHADQLNPNHPQHGGGGNKGGGNKAGGKK